jgi:CubicO group peptidase (beta-lactamase class C family)
MATETSVQGYTARGFEPVRAAFEENLRSGRELGAACALQRDGEILVDLWGGERDPRRALPWTADSLVLVYSVAKGASALALALLHERGLLDYDARVASYWPGFAQGGKEDITVRQLLAHEAGLAAIDERLDAALLGDPDRLLPSLERQRPSHPPGAKHTYHAITLGFYQSELVRRIDPATRTLGRFLREELATPIEAECYIGLPAEIATDRVAPIQTLNPLGSVFHPRSLSPRLLVALACPWTLTARALRNPKLRGPASLDAPALRAVEMPASNAITNARALVRLYDAFLRPGGPLGLSAATTEALAAPARLPPAGSWDQVFKRHTAYALGFMKPTCDFRFGSSERAFGAPGLGGSLAFADPDSGTAYAYVTNRLGYSVFNEPRERTLREACWACLRKA